MSQMIFLQDSMQVEEVKLTLSAKQEDGFIIVFQTAKYGSGDAPVEIGDMTLEEAETLISKLTKMTSEIRRINIFIASCGTPASDVN